MGSSRVVPIAIGVGVALAICFGVLFSSFADIEFHEMGFAKSKTTGSVFTDKVLQSGRHWLGPDKTVKKFDATGHVVSLSKVTAFVAADKKESGADDGGGVTVTLGVGLVYFLVAEDLKLLHDEYDVSYQSLIETTAQAAVKDAANNYKLKDFYDRREEVEANIHRDVRRRLGGICCPVSRKETGCKARSECTNKDKGMFVDVRYLHITSFEIPYSVERHNLRTIILTEETSREDYVQQAAIIEKETEQLVTDINNQAQEVQANANAQSELIAARSKVKYQEILDNARRQGLKMLYDSLGFSAAEHKNSFDYLRSLGDHQSAHLSVNFDQLIVGPTNYP